MLIPLLHARVATVTVVCCAGVGLWGLWLAFRKQELTTSFLGALLLNEAIFLAQGSLGLMMVLQGTQPGQGVHYLYGVVALLALPVTLLVTRARRTSREAAIYGATCLFLSGVALRAAATGPF